MANPYESPQAPTEREGNQASPTKGKPSSARPLIATIVAMLIVLFSTIAGRPDSPAFLRIASGPFSYALRADATLVAWIVAMLCLIGVGSCVVHPRWYTAILALLSLLAWLGMGLLAERLEYVPYPSS